MNLGKFGPLASNAVPVLRTILQGATDSYLRCKVAVAIWRIDGDAETALPVLLQELPRENEAVRWDEITALGEMGPRAKEALPLLESQLYLANRTIRGRTTNAIAKIDPDTAARLGIR